MANSICYPRQTQKETYVFSRTRILVHSKRLVPGRNKWLSLTAHQCLYNIAKVTTDCFWNSSLD